MMEGVSGEGVRRRREYKDETEEAKIEDLTAAELVREKFRAREVKESDEETEVSTREVVEQIVRELQQDAEKEREVSKKLGEVLDELEREELETKSTEERLREALDEVVEEESSEPVDRSSEESTGHYGELRSKEEFDKVLENYPETELRKDFEGKYQASETYFDRLENGEDSVKPSLVGEIEQKELRRRYEEENGPLDVKLESMEDVDRLMEEHSDETSKTSRDYQSAEVYFAIRSESEKSQHQLAEEYGVSQSTISNCQRGVEKGLVKRLREREEERIIREWADSKSVLEDMNLEDMDTRKTIRPNESLDVQRIEPEVIKESMKQIGEAKDLGSKEMADIISQMKRESPESESRVMMADLTRSETDDRMISVFEKVLKIHRREIQETLKEKLEAEDPRVGMIKGRLYVWTPDRTPNDMINAWRTQYYYFDNRSLSKIVDDVGDRLGIGDSRREKLRNINDLTDQIVHKGPSTGHIKIKDDKSRLVGEALHFQRDVMGNRTKEYEGLVNRVTGINGHGGITNPKFPEEQTLESLRARLIATSLSDCHIRKEDGIVEYYEENIRRIEQVINQTLSQFGDFTNIPEYNKEDNVYRLKIQSPYGRALMEWGVPAGDKAIHNPGLPLEAREWSSKSTSAYQEDMIAEEGHVSRGSVSWNRSNTLNAGKKSSEYGFEDQISRREIEMIMTEGKRYCGDFEGEKVLLWSKIEKLRKSNDSETSEIAQKIYDTVLENHNQLIDDERFLASKLGIDVSIRPVEVTHYKGSGRVSVKWEAKTANSDMAIRWGLICPPNHPEKKEALMKWIKEQNPDRIKRIKEEVEQYGFEIHRVWSGEID
ncbi:MAG: hypothetical protein ACFFDD_02185 [Promethearchaeota archaeon]